MFTYKTTKQRLPWHLLTVVILFLIGYFFVYAALTTNYKWQWNRVPQYFLYQDTTTERATTAATVTNIQKKGKQAVITLTDLYDDTESTLTVPANALKVNIDDELYEGDIISSTPPTWVAGLLLQGLWTTLWISAISAVISLIIGLVMGVWRLSKNPTLKYLSSIYIELIRGIPLLVLIFTIYFLIGTLLQLSREVAAIASIALCSGAYIAEIIRGGIQSIPKGQTEAARSLGMGQLSTMGYIILPQAIKRSIPALTGQLINLIKDTSLLSIISIADLSKIGREIVNSTAMPFEVWLCVAMLYLVITLPLSLLTYHLEKRLSKSD